jgi:hypothetical protein
MRALAPRASPYAAALAAPSRRRTVARAAAQRHPPATPLQPWSAEAAARARALDDTLSSRPLQLDPAGYFLIAVRHAEGLITCEHYANTINAQGASPCPALRDPTLPVNHALVKR